MSLRGPARGRRRCFEQLLKLTAGFAQVKQRHQCKLEAAELKTGRKGHLIRALSDWIDLQSESQ